MDLTEELRRRGLTQADLAQATGLNQATISLIASGRSPGRPATLRLIRTALAGHTLAAPGYDPPSEPIWPGVLVKSRAWGLLDGWDGAELGGWLIGRDLGDRLVVEAVSEEERALRSARSISLDLRRIPDVERAQAPGVGVIGCYHGHAADMSEFASRGDRDSWAYAAATLGHTWLGLVIREPQSRGQIESDVMGYLTRPNGETKRIVPVRI